MRIERFIKVNPAIGLRCTWEFEDFHSRAACGRAAKVVEIEIEDAPLEHIIGFLSGYCDEHAKQRPGGTAPTDMLGRII